MPYKSNLLGMPTTGQSPYGNQLATNPFWGALQPAPQPQVSASSYLPYGTSTSTGIDMQALRQQPYTPPSSAGLLDSGNTTAQQAQDQPHMIHGQVIWAPTLEDAYNQYISNPQLYQPGGMFT